MKKTMSAVFLLMILLIPVSALACEHRFGPWKTKTSATCTREAHQFRYCQKCDHWEQRRTAKLPHTPGEMTVTKEPTCTEKGRQEAVCQVCERLVRYNIDKLPHNDGEMTVTKEPTCTAAGTGEYTCMDCGRTRRETIERLGHDWGAEHVVKEPSCAASGTGEMSCLRCGATQKTKIDKLEHVFGEWTVTIEPQGKRKGTRESTCTLCGRAQQERFYWEGTLYEGMKACEEVIAMQEMLRDLGFYNGSIRSGQFGNLTALAVARFQESVSLNDTGVADPQTIEALEKAWENATGKTVVDTLNVEEMESAVQAQMMAE